MAAAVTRGTGAQRLPFGGPRCLAQLRQRIVFAEDGRHRFAAAGHEGSRKGRRNVRDALFDRKTFGSQRLFQRRSRLFLFVSQFRVAPDLSCQRFDAVRLCVDHLG